MTDTRDAADPDNLDPVPVVVPYARFLECRARRHPIAAGLAPTDQPPTGDAAATPRPANRVWKQS